MIVERISIWEIIFLFVVYIITHWMIYYTIKNKENNGIKKETLKTLITVNKYYSMLYLIGILFYFTIFY